MRRDLCLATAWLLLGTAPGLADPAGSKTVSVHHGKVYQTKTAGLQTQGFVEVDNRGGLPDTLTGADCPIAGWTRLVGPNGAPIRQLPIPAGANLDLAPKGPHLLLQSTHFSINPGGAIPCSLSFLNAGTILVYLYAVPPP